MRIAVPAGHFKWGGGIDFLKNLMRSLQGVDGRSLEITVLIPDNAEPLLYGRDSAFSRFLSGVGVFFAEATDRLLRRNVFSREDYENAYCDFDTRVSFAYHNTSQISLIACLKHIHADVVFPVLRPFSRRFPFPWVGYVFDMQHRYCPRNFGLLERGLRNLLFRSMLSRAKTVIVNALAAKADLEIAYPKHKSRIVALPVCPSLNRRWFSTNVDDVREKYDLPEKYFAISNQFFVHKGYDTAFDAFAMLRREGCVDDVYLVCTGDTSDVRDSRYFGELLSQIEKQGIDDRVRFVGYVSKEDQIQILWHSMAVIQPTLFEGGPGGGSGQEAMAMSKRLILSDIWVNRELAGEAISFFRAGDSGELRDRMEDVLRQPRSYPDLEELFEASDRRRTELGKTLVGVIESVVEH